MIAVLLRATGVMLAAAMLYGMQRTTPLYSDITSPVAFSGQQGKRTDTSEFAIAVARIHVAQRLVVPGIAKERIYTTSGVWIVVEAAVEAKGASLALTSAEWLGPNGASNLMSQRLSAFPGLLGSERFDPGIPRPTLMIFEVPESQITGAKLRVLRSSLIPLVEVAEIEMVEVQPDNIRSEIVFGRGGRLVPWTLEER